MDGSQGLLVISHDICYYPQIKEKKPVGNSMRRVPVSSLRSLIIGLEI
jgi:hypothetical protein